MLLPGKRMKGLLLRVQITIAKTILLQESIGKDKKEKCGDILFVHPNKAYLKIKGKIKEVRNFMLFSAFLILKLHFPSESRVICKLENQSLILIFLLRIAGSCSEIPSDFYCSMQTCIKKLVNLSAKIKALEKPVKMNHKEIQTQTEKFKGETNLVLSIEKPVKITYREIQAQTEEFKGCLLDSLFTEQGDSSFVRTTEFMKQNRYSIYKMKAVTTD
ncbi:hypothetical protein STEG23_036545 [Scotinomys teguina]